jgi:hypothetical protein
MQAVEGEEHGSGGGYLRPLDRGVAAFLPDGVRRGELTASGYRSGCVSRMASLSYSQMQLISLTECEPDLTESLLDIESAREASRSPTFAFCRG